MVQWAGIIFAVVLLVIVIVIGVVLYRISKEPQCQQNSDCPAGGVCKNNKCEAKPCSTTSDCPDGQVCSGGQCLTQECSTTNDCPAGDICSNGLCILQTNCTSDSDCPAGQSCDTSTGLCQAETTLYVKNTIAQTNSSCPSGYTLAQGYGTNGGTTGNGDLKQGTGDSTPNIYLCLEKSPGTADAIQDIIVYQFGLGSENTCPDPYNRIVYNWNGRTQYNYEAGCPDPVIQTKLCQTTSSNNLLQHGPIQDILVTINNSCPTGYVLGTYSTSTLAANIGANGDINYSCGGQTVRLCIK